MSWIDALGWISTVLFLGSFLFKDRATLHLVGFVACIFKMAYSYHHAVWPLFTNWVILLVVDAVQWWRYKAGKVGSEH
jgi:ABC-type sulfate transport system permease component